MKEYAKKHPAHALAERRGHTAERLLVKPTIANLVLWRSIYSSGDRFYVDAIRIGPGPERIYPGVSAPAFDLERDLPGLPTNSLQALDIERFTALSEGFVAADPRRDGVLIDIRYSMLPTSIAPMWGLDVKVASATQHARFELYRDRPDNYRELFIAMLLGRELPE